MKSERARLEEIKAELFYQKWSPSDTQWLIDQLEQAWAREQKYREALEFYACKDETIEEQVQYEVDASGEHRLFGWTARSALKALASGPQEMEGGG